MASYTGTSILDILTKNIIADGLHTFTNVNGVNLGSVEVLNFYGNQTASVTPTEGNATNRTPHFEDIDAHQDDIMCIRIYHGNLTINSGVTYRPPYRTKGMFVLVKNNLINNGIISMAERGSTAAAPGGPVVLWSGASVAASGSIGGPLRNPQGQTTTGTGLAGFNGTNGSGRNTGGGGGGAAQRLGGTNSTATSGAGAQGTAWSGGAGGGAALSWNVTTSATGGSTSTGGNGAIAITAGSTSWVANTFFELGGGAGNPQGKGSRFTSSATSVSNGTGTLQTTGSTMGGLGAGGLLMVAVLNRYSQNSSTPFSVAGSKGGTGNTNYSDASFNGLFVNNGTASGGGSGGGSFNMIASFLDTGLTELGIETATSVSGGAGGDNQFNGVTNSAGHKGGAGGNGTANVDVASTTYRRHLFYSDGKNYYYNPTTSQWVEALGAGTEPFELYGLLDTELTTITYSQISSIPNVSLSDIRIRTFSNA